VLRKKSVLGIPELGIVVAKNCGRTKHPTELSLEVVLVDGCVGFLQSDTTW
jgi:hypothetical protein